MASITLSAEDAGVTFIGVWTLHTPEQQQELVERMRADVKNAFARAPGFVGAALMPSIDGKQVVVHFRWRSQQDFEAAVGSDEAGANRAALKELGEQAGNLYKVDSVFLAADRK